MGRKFIVDEVSPFYPPRARWYAVFFYLGNAVRRRLALDRLNLPQGVSIGGLAAAFFVPALGVCLRGGRFWGRVAPAACAILVSVYILWLGYPAGNLAFGLLLSVHATGFVYYCNPLMAEEPFRWRLAFTFMVLLALAGALYWPARSFVQQHWLTPLRVNGQVVVVRRTASAPVIRRGDWLAYSLADSSLGEMHHGGEVVFHSGAGFGRALAVAGDHVVFSANGFSVNGVSHASLPHMPAEGEWIVPEKHWFVWPNLAISGHGNVSEENFNRILLRLADVAPNQFLGQPCHRWFWRQQVLP